MTASAGYFDLPTRQARQLLPAHLQPFEHRPGGSILAVTSFDFHDSPVGPYQELVLSIVVAPLVLAGQAFPKAAMYPYLVATSTRISREHGIERWKLPHWMEDVEIRFDRTPGSASIQVFAGSDLVLAMTITDHPVQTPVSDRYQVFVQDEHMADVIMAGQSSEHEEETGALTLYPHAFHGPLPVEEVDLTPFLEQWLKAGTETFHPIVPVPRV